MITLFRKKYRLTSVTANDVEIALGHWPGPGPTVLCLHGLTANHKCWVLAAEDLQKHGFNVYAMDLRGRGRSDKPRDAYGVEVHARDVIGVIRSLGKLHVHLLCHSFGCNVGIRVAAEFPKSVRSMILMDGGGVLSVRQKLRIIGVLEPSFRRLLGAYRDEDAYLNALKESPFITEWSDMIEDHFRYEMEHTPEGVRCNIPAYVIETEMSALGGSMTPGRIARKIIARPGRFIEKARRNNNPPYSAISRPVLILRAGKHNLAPGDDLLPAEAVERMLREIPGARAHEFPTANHYGIIGDDLPERDKMIREFFREHG